ncbi:MAG: prepilin-type N-terminal cleavage/methylation domain-containing protein [Campylobacterota bacterium]
MKNSFTIIEMIISTTILSIMMLFLYESYSSLNSSNIFYKKEVSSIKADQLKKRVLFLDLTLAFAKSIKIFNQASNQDVVFFQSSNSIYKNYNPYIAYIMKDSRLYRLESLKEFTVYPLDVDMDMNFSVECLGEVDSFRVYKSKNTYLLHIDFKKDDDILLKIKVLNQ